MNITVLENDRALECGNTTEGGDRLCPLCREKFGEDQARIDRVITHRANTRNLTRDGIIRALTVPHKEAAE